MTLPFSLTDTNCLNDGIQREIIDESASESARIEICMQRDPHAVRSACNQICVQPNLRATRFARKQIFACFCEVDSHVFDITLARL